jgi:general stress protein CsbA
MFYIYFYKGGWIFGEVVCNAWILSSIWFCCASILSLCGVTWDRYVAVTSPLRYTSRMTDRHVTRIIVAIWVTSLTVGIVNSYGLKTSPARVLCGLHGLPLIYTTFDFILLFVLPLILVFFVNRKIWKAASRQSRRIQVEIPIESFRNIPRSHDNTNDVSTDSPNVPGPQAPPPTYNQNLRKAEIKTFRTFLIVTASFFCSWTPFFLVIVIDCSTRVSPTVVYLCAILTYINSASNPLIYGIFNKDFRQALLDCCTC